MGGSRISRVVGIGIVGGVAVAAGACPCQDRSTTIVQVAAVPAVIHTSETSEVHVNVSNSGTPVTNAVVKYTAGPGGTIPPSGKTDGVGNDSVLFTAGVVSVDTEVEITALSGQKATASVTVRPPIMFADYGSAATAVTTADVTVAPSVIPAGITGGALLSYVVEVRDSTRMKNFFITFAKPVNITAPAGATSTNNNTIWLINWPVNAKRLTVVGNSDSNVGGLAKFEFYSSSAPHHALVPGVAAVR